MLQLLRNSKTVVGPSTRAPCLTSDLTDKVVPKSCLQNSNLSGAACQMEVMLGTHGRAEGFEALTDGPFMRHRLSDQIHAFCGLISRACRHAGCVIYLCHELPGALQADSSVCSAVGEVLLRFELLSALHVVASAHKRLSLLLRCISRLSLHLCMQGTSNQLPHKCDRPSILNVLPGGDASSASQQQGSKLLANGKAAVGNKHTSRWALRRALCSSS